MWTLASVFSPLWLKCVKNMWINWKKTVASTREKEIKERSTRNCLKRTKKLFPRHWHSCSIFQCCCSFHTARLLFAQTHHCYSRSHFHVCRLDLNVWFFPSNLPFLFLCLRLLQSVSLPLREIKVEADVVLMAISSSCADTFTVCAAYLLN